MTFPSMPTLTAASLLLRTYVCEAGSSPTSTTVRLGGRLARETMSWTSEAISL